MFIAVNSKTPQADPILPPNAEFLAALQADDVVGPPDLADEEKKMLLAALRFYFGPAQWWNAVAKEALGPLRFYFRPVKWWNAVVQDLDLGPAFANARPAVDQIELYATKRDNPDHPEHLPSYFLYEAQNNLMLYVGPDFLHNLVWHVVINTMVLNPQHRPVESYTLRLG